MPEEVDQCAARRLQTVTTDLLDPQSA